MNVASRKKYRSVKRDEPRIIYPPDIDGRKREEPPIGSIRYAPSAPSFSQMIYEAKKHNAILVRDSFSELLESIEKCLDQVHALAAQHIWSINGVPDAIPHDAHDLLFSCFHKSLLNLHVATNLTEAGLFGVARPQLRQAFEYLVIAKLCATDPDSDIYDKWVDGIGVYLTNGVIKRIVYPNTKELSGMWSDLCECTHATIYAAQWDADLKNSRQDISANLAMICILLNFQDHILGTHILTKAVRYYSERYGDPDKICSIRQSLREELKLASKGLSKFSKLIVRSYRATWQLTSDA